MNIIIFIIILLVLVVSHEFGHFIVAKKAGIRVDEFAFGFKPRLFSVKKGETTYSINALPIGGYVKIFGEDPDDENTNGPDRARSFVHKPKYIQAAVMLGGVAMNFLLAWILLSFSFVSGLPTSVGLQETGVVENAVLTNTHVALNSPAFDGGLMVGDKILSMQAGNLLTQTPSVESVQYFVAKHSDEEIKISFERGKGEISETTIIPKMGIIESDKPAIGVSMDMIGVLKLPIHKAIISGLKLTWDLTRATAVGLFDLIVNSVRGTADISSVTGPIGIVGIVGDAVSFGFVYLLSLTAIISINLVIINLIPFPALDGGRLLFLLIEKIKGSRINPKIANIVNMIGFGLLMLLMVVITYHDIVKIVK